MKKLLLITATVIFIQTSNAQTTIDYFGQTPPGDTAIVFAPGIVSLSNRLEDKITFSPDGKECFFATGDGLYNMKFINNKWTSPKIATLKLNPEDQKPAFSKDGNRLYFTRFDPNYTTCNIGYFERTIDGWSDPVFPPSPFNTSSWEFDFTESNDGLMYIASNRSGNEDIWLIKTLENNSFQAVNLGPTVNSSGDDFSPCVAHDGSYLIFASTRNSDQDLFISFNKGNNEWTKPINMNSGGAKINFPGFSEKDPSFSPDGKYLFFNHHTSSNLRDIIDIYWVSTHILDTLKKIAMPTTLVNQVIDEKVMLYPNPSKGHITLSLGTAHNKEALVEIYNLQGAQVFSKTFHNTPSATIDLTGKATGIYVVKVNAGGVSYEEKILKE